MTTAYERLAGVIGQLVVENARLGEMTESLQSQVAALTKRAEDAEYKLKEVEGKRE